jgi:Alpha-amylase/4-alpha-glucanotransferase, C-terminal
MKGELDAPDHFAVPFRSHRPRPPAGLSITKHFLLGPAPQGCEISCDVTLSASAPLPRPLRFGIESVINFLAPGEADRFFETSTGPQTLGFSGALPGPIVLEDGWQRIRATLHAPGSEEFWIAPIETVSESEGGFEPVDQGSQMLVLWPADLTAKTSFSARLMWRLECF